METAARYANETREKCTCLYTRSAAYQTGSVDGRMYADGCGWIGVPKHFCVRRAELVAYMRGFVAAVVLHADEEGLR